MEREIWRREGERAGEGLLMKVPLHPLMRKCYCFFAVFEQAGIDLDQPLVASCGSGVTATILAFAAFILHKDVPVYDVRMM